MVYVLALGKIFSGRHIEIFFLIFPENRTWHFMQIVSIGDKLHEMSNLVFLEKYEKKNHQFVICFISPESGNG